MFGSKAGARTAQLRGDGCGVAAGRKPTRVRVSSAGLTILREEICAVDGGPILGAAARCRLAQCEQIPHAPASGPSGLHDLSLAATTGSGTVPFASAASNGRIGPLRPVKVRRVVLNAIPGNHGLHGCRAGTMAAHGVGMPVPVSNTVRWGDRAQCSRPAGIGPALDGFDGQGWIKQATGGVRRPGGQAVGHAMSVPLKRHVGSVRDRRVKIALIAVLERLDSLP